MSNLSTAIIGCGVIGRTHVEAVLQSFGARARG